MQRSDIRLLQNELKEAGLYDGEIDGQRGDKTGQAVRAALLKRTDILPPEWESWSGRRKMVALVQLACHEAGIDAGPIDGFYGMTTENAADLLRVLVTTGSLPRHFSDIDRIEANPHDLPREARDDLDGFYGLVEQPSALPITRVDCPWRLRLDWDLQTTTRKIAVHEKLADSVSKVLDSALQHYGLESIVALGLDRYGGGFNHRKKRGSTTSWSTHAWGIALDWFPSRNKLSWRSDRASLAHPDLDFWWEAWEQEGWLSLGRAEDRDWMHVQAAQR